MKRAIIYSRVSTTEQADRGYSLADQEARLRAYCRRQGMEVVRHFQDDASAKTFDRPAFQQLLAFVRANRRVADVLLVVKWDRFSRDATGALSMIRTLDELGIQVQAIEQPVDLSVPEQLMMLAIYVAAPEVENRCRSIATKQGLRRATRQGRYCNRAPIGYQNCRNEHGRPSIVPDEEAAWVRRAFEQAAARPDLPMEEIRRRLLREARRAGSRFTISRSRFTQILRNPLYAGKVPLSAWRGEPEEIIDGLHEPIISEALFQKVQERFEKPLFQDKKAKLVEELPLRGHLLCPACSEMMTGSASRGRSKKYWYYHCHHCTATRFRADVANAALPAYLRQAQISPEVRALYRHVIEDVSQRSEMRRRQRLVSVEREIETLEEKLFRVDEAYIESELAPDSYRRLKAGYDAQLQQLRLERVGLEEGAETFAEHLRFAVSLLSNLGRIWQRAPLEGKDELLVRIFPDHLIFDGESF